jgi:hypothetical protein
MKAVALSLACMPANPNQSLWNDFTMQTNFADTILNMSRTGGLVRIDLGTLTPVQNNEGKQELRAVVTQQLIMPLEGFIKSYEVQEGLIKKLVEEGVLKSRESAEQQDGVSITPPSH